MLFIDTLPSSHLLPGLTKANCHRATRGHSETSLGLGEWRELHQHPALDHSLRQMRAPRLEVLPPSLHTLMLSALFYPVLPRHRGPFRFLGALQWPKPNFTSGSLDQATRGSQDPDHSL